MNADRALRDLPDLPGPRGWPVIGKLLQIERDRLHWNVEAWHREFGPVFRFRLGRRTLLGLVDHEAIAAALRDRPDGFRRSRQLESTGNEMGLAPGVFGANGAVWKNQRRMVTRRLRPDSCQGLLSVAAENHAALACPLGDSSRQRRTARVAARTDAVHGRRDRGPRLRRRHRHAGLRRRRSHG